MSLNWQGNKFASILDFAAANFEIIRIDVTDALYRHNFMAKGLNAEQALAQANALGALWLSQHQDIMDSCPIKPNIIRWAEWYKHPCYKDTLDKFVKAHQVSQTLSDAVSRDAVEFYRRKGVEPSLIEIEHAKNYLIEEMAVITIQARELASVKIYPGEELESLNVVRNGKVLEAPKGLEFEQYAKIKIEKRAGRIANLNIESQDKNLHAANMYSER